MQQRRLLITVDDDADWLDLLRPALATGDHRFVLAEKAAADRGRAAPEADDAHWRRLYPALEAFASDWSLVFIDNAPWSARHLALLAFRARADYVMIHDVDYFPDNGVFGRTLRQTVPHGDHGERSYDDVLRHWVEYMPPEPWPAPTGPPTLLGSDRHDRFPTVDVANY